MTDGSLGPPPSASRVASQPKPTPDTWRVFLHYAIGVQVVWLAVYGGASWLTASHARRVSLAMPWDEAIPFAPAAAVVYLSLPVMLWLAPLYLATPGEMRAFGKQLVIVILVAGIGFVSLPANQPAVPAMPEGFGAAMFRVADWVNLDHNLFPSLHVAMATLAAISFSRHVNIFAKLALVGWACGIAASALLIRDHYIADVLTGALLGACVFGATRHWERSSEPDRAGLAPAADP